MPRGLGARRIVLTRGGAADKLTAPQPDSAPASQSPSTTAPTLAAGLSFVLLYSAGNIQVSDRRS